MEHPLIHYDKRSFDISEVRDGVLGKHRETVRIDKLRNTVVYLGIHMIRASAENDAAPTCLGEIL